MMLSFTAIASANDGRDHMASSTQPKPSLRMNIPVKAGAMRDINHIDNKMERLENKNASSTNTRMMEKRNEQLKMLAAKRGEKVKQVVKHATNIVSMITERIAKLDEIALKLSSKVAELSTVGLNVADAKILLDGAVVKLSTAKTDIMAVKTSIEEATGETVDKALAKSMRESFQKIEKNTISAHKDLTRTASILRDIIKKDRNDHPTASSTAPAAVQ